MTTLIKYISILAISASLCACFNKDRAERLMQNPEITTVKSVNGCEVKFVDRGYRSNSFYIANCPNSTTITRIAPHDSETMPNPVMVRNSAVISKEIERLNAERARSEIWEKRLHSFNQSN